MAVQISGNDITVPRDGTFTRNVTIGGTLTYEDVTNIDSVGLITARTGIEIGARPGVAASISVDGNMIVSGISTFGGDVFIADKIIHDGDTNTAIRFPEADHISFEVGLTGEAMRIDNGGKLLIGLDDRRLFGSSVTSKLQIEGTTATGTDAASLSITNNQDSNGAPSIRFGKTRGTSIGSNTSVADGDNIGQIVFYGADGTDIYNATALIGAKVNGTVGTDTIPTDIVFQTSATTGSGRAERARITSGGRVLINSTVSRNIGSNISRMLQIESSGGGAGIAVVRNSNNTSGPTLDLGKSRGYPNTIVQDGDKLGIINFSGADGTDLQTTAVQISGEVDGTPGSNDLPGRIVFKTTANGSASTSERARITNDGYFLLATNGTTQKNLGQGNTDVGIGLNPAGRLNGSRDGAASILLNRNTSAGPIQVFYLDGVQEGYINITTSGISMVNSSDYRLKENETTISDGITRVKQLIPRRFNFKVDKDTTVDGFFAHEVSPVVPESVFGEKDATVNENGEGYQGLDQSKLIPVLTASIKELITKVETLEAEVAALKG